MHKEDINKVKSAHSDYVFNTLGHVVEKDNYPVSKNVSFTVEDCELAYVKQEHYRVSLQNETTTFEELKYKFAAQNLLLKSIKEVVDEDSYNRLVSGMQIELWRKDEMVVTKGERGDKLYFVSEGKVACFENLDGPST